MAELKQKIDGQLALPPEQIPIIELFDNLIEYSNLARSSDIHIDPFKDKVMVRLRIDGIMHDAFTLPKEIQSEIITRIKVLSNLRTDEHNIPQDGRFGVKVDIMSFDVRVSIAPTYYGENAVLRILAEQTHAYVLENLGFSDRDLSVIEKAIIKPYGMILTTGPTGSGKSTTLYTMLKKLKSEEVTIITIEDPIEFSIEGISQMQVNTKTGLTFADGLRSILRQDPNIVMVGEIRDSETAGIAVNAALTGHLLLSTLHTNNAATALPRLIDMGIQPFLIASTVNVVIGQRLVRTICQDCKTEKKLNETELNSLKEILPESLHGKIQNKFYIGKGCEECGHTGYRGRIGIREVLEINQKIRELIMQRANASEIGSEARASGMTTIFEDAYLKAVNGVVSLEEVLKLVHE